MRNEYERELGLGGFLAAVLIFVACLATSGLVVLCAGALWVSWTKTNAVFLLILVGIGVVLVPSLLLNVIVSGMRRLWNRHATFRDTFLSVTLTNNALVLLTLILALPHDTATALLRYGHWPFSREVAQIFQINEHHPVLRKGRSFVRRMAYLLEEEGRPLPSYREEPPPPPSRSTLAKKERLSPSNTPEKTSANPSSPPPIRDLAPPLERFPLRDPEPVAPRPAVRNPEPSPAIKMSEPSAKRVALKYIRYGTSAVVPLRLGGEKLRFLLDTGASYLTLSRTTAERLGALPPRDAPVMVLQTANGKIRTRVGLLRELRMGKFRIRNVAFVLCDACADDQRDVVGLLGLNILQRFLFTMDHQNGTILLEPQPANPPNLSADMRPFLKYTKLNGSTLDLVFRRTFRLKGYATNLAPRTMMGVQVRIIYMKGKEEVGTKDFTLPPLQPGQRRHFSLSDSGAPRFERYRVDLHQGHWGP
ncbi:MAG: clan AA aspartic protease [Myxococcales bacterium]|nr:clan AA aspartic protease [Myxococcales bacterium]MCB9642112.1 clan AA aspartic protease [Myxococcales bacterium]